MTFKAQKKLMTFNTQNKIFIVEIFGNLGPTCQTLKNTKPNTKTTCKTGHGLRAILFACGDRNWPDPRKLWKSSVGPAGIKKFRVFFGREFFSKYGYFAKCESCLTLKQVCLEI